ncbi:hypothetical protein [Prosthecobacter sp.]|uniref:hypothetical protein n=1 Tax=Prosthecobacter sp. TaxID=1965333 RepID=UPI003784E942
MKLPSPYTLVVLLVGLSLTLTACQYPNHAYAYDDLGRPVGRGIFRHQSTAASPPLASLSSSVLGSNRDHYYYVISGPNAGSRYYTSPTYHTRSYYSRTGPLRSHASPARSHPIYRISYERHPYYSNPIYSSPYYSRSSSSSQSYTNRSWGGGYGFGMPYNWGIGLGLGSRWF